MPLKQYLIACHVCAKVGPLAHPRAIHVFFVVTPKHRSDHPKKETTYPPFSSSQKRKESGLSLQNWGARKVIDAVLFLCLLLCSSFLYTDELVFFLIIIVVFVFVQCRVSRPMRRPRYGTGCFSGQRFATPYNISVDQSASPSSLSDTDLHPVIRMHALIRNRFSQTRKIDFHL